MGETLQPDKTADNKEVRGFTWRQMIHMICAVVTIVATVVWAASRITNKLDQVILKTDANNLELSKLKEEMNLIKLDVSRLKSWVEAEEKTRAYYIPPPQSVRR